MTTGDIDVVRVRDASKMFVLRHDKSFKEKSIHALRGGNKKDEFWALKDVNLDITAGTTVGLVGHNGSGKSTLLKLIGGILQPTTGMVERRGRLAALLELGAGFHPDLSGRDNVFLNASILGLTKQQTAKYFDAIVDFSGIEQFIDTQVKFYSSGMYVRLAFSVAVHVDPDVLLVDEVLSVGDEPFQRKCMDRIHEFQTEGRTIVLVSHSAGQVGELCDRALVLDGGHVVYDGPAEQGLRVLRLGYEETRQEEAAAKSGQARTIPVGGEVARVEMLDASGTPTVDIASGDALDIVLTFTTKTPLPHWRAGISIETPLAQIVFGTNTELARIDLPPLDSTCTVHFRIPHVDLVAGEYYVTAALELPDGTAIDWKSQAAMFSVRSDVMSIGTANLKPVIEAQPFG